MLVVVIVKRLLMLILSQWVLMLARPWPVAPSDFAGMSAPFSLLCDCCVAASLASWMPTCAQLILPTCQCQPLGLTLALMWQQPQCRMGHMFLLLSLGMPTGVGGSSSKNVAQHRVKGFGNAWQGAALIYPAVFPALVLVARSSWVLLWCRPGKFCMACLLLIPKWLACVLAGKAFANVHARLCFWSTVLWLLPGFPQHLSFQQLGWERHALMSTWCEMLWWTFQCMCTQKGWSLGLLIGQHWTDAGRILLKRNTAPTGSLGRSGCH